MKTRYRLLAWCLVFMLPAAAHAANTLFWKVTSPGGGTVYLLGSLHAATPDIYPLPSAIEAAFRDSDYLVLEADPSTGLENMMGLIREKGMYPGGRTLQDDLPAKSYRAFAEECAKSGLDVEFLKPMRPWLAALTYTQAALARLGFDPQYGIEFHFLSELPENRKVIELESMERQIDLLAGLAPELQAAFLEQTVAETAQLPETVGRMRDLWKSGDGERLAEFAEQSFDKSDAGMSALYRKLIVDRNVDMTRAIAGYLATPKTYFVIVGAGHLLGSKGIVASLRAKGFAAAAPLSDANQ